jgi:hypothetical protein
MREYDLNGFLKEMSFGSEFRILEGAKDKEELDKIAAKRGIVLPATDLAIFKCTYAFVDKTNKNGCSLPKDEIIASLPTLVGKAVDFEHLRGVVIGYWIDAELIEDTIYAYGIFLKGNFPKDYEKTKEAFDKGELAVSFEAYGKRVFKEDGTYDLTSIEFAGGALLIKNPPAFTGAGVSEMGSHSEFVLEFASVIVEPKSFVRGDKNMEDAKVNIWEAEYIGRGLSEVKCPICDMQGWFEVNEMNYDESMVKMTCGNCRTKLHTKLIPQTEVIKKGKKPEMLKASLEQNIDFSFVEKFEGSESKLLEIVSSRIALIKGSELEKVLSTADSKLLAIFAKLNIKVEDVKNTLKTEENLITKSQEETQVEEKVKELETKLSTTETELATIKAELATKDSIIETLKKESEEAKVKIEAVEKAKVEEVEKAKKEAVLITERKASLGAEYAKDMKDEDILDNAKFEIATLKKELALAKLAVKEVKTTEVATIVGGEKIEEGKEEVSKTKREKVRKAAFGE